MSLTVGIDLDGVVANFGSSYRRLIVETLGSDLFHPEYDERQPHIWDWDLHAGYTSEQLAKVWEVIKNHEFFWSALDALPGARHLRHLDHKVNKIYYITSRPGKTSKYQTENWLKAHGVVSPTVLICKDMKGLVAKGLELDVFIDDKIENCLDVVRDSPATRVYVLDYPYNQFEHGECIRVNSFTQALEKEGLIKLEV